MLLLLPQAVFRVTAVGVKDLVSSKGRISTLNSPVKMTLIPSPNSPFQKVRKLVSSDMGEADQSNNEADNTIKSQENGNPKLDAQELAQEILEEMQSHLTVAEYLQRSAPRGPRQAPGRWYAGTPKHTGLQNLRNQHLHQACRLPSEEPAIACHHSQARISSPPP